MKNTLKMKMEDSHRESLRLNRVMKKAPKDWTGWQEFAANAPESKVRQMVLDLVLKMAGRQGQINALEFMLKIVKDANGRAFDRLVAVCEENEMLGGMQGRKAMAAYTKKKKE